MDKKNSIINIQDVGLSTKYGCIMCTTIVYQRTADVLVCLVCQKSTNCAQLVKLR
jgi:hypothetical protein